MNLEDSVELRYQKLNGNKEYSSECKKAYQKYQQIKELLMEREDAKGLALLDELVVSAQRYIQSVVRMDLPQSLQYRLETWEFQEQLQELDKARKISHDALIAQLRATNRYLFKNYQAGEEVPYGGVYSLSPHTLSPTIDRFAVGEWAGYLILGLYEQRKKS